MMARRKPTNKQTITEMVSEVFSHGIPGGVSTFLDFVVDDKPKDKNASIDGDESNGESKEKGIPVEGIPVEVWRHLFGFAKVCKTEYKILIVGYKGVGKRSFVESISGKEFPRDNTYSPVITPIVMNTVYGPIKFNIWNMPPAQLGYGSLHDGYYINADGAIIMFDLASLMTYRYVGNYHRDITRACGGDIPVVVCGNNAHDKDRKVKAGQIRFHHKKRQEGCTIDYLDLSNESNRKYAKPFHLLVHMLNGGRDPHIPFSSPKSSSAQH